MRKRYKISLLLILILLSFSVFVSFSYAKFLFSNNQSENNIASSDCFKITYEDSNDISLLNAIPLSEDKALKYNPYTFTISNVCNLKLSYDILIEVLDTTTIDLDAVRYKLDDNNSKILGSVKNNDANTFINQGVSSSKTIFTGELDSKQSASHSLYEWVDFDATAEQAAEKEFYNKVVVSATYTAKSGEGTLISGINFNEALKRVAHPNQNYVYTTGEHLIHHLIESDSMPGEGTNYVNVATSDSDNPIYAWFDTDTIYFYTKNKKIYLNSNSSYMFFKFEEIEGVLDLSSFDASKVKNMSFMFSNMRSGGSINFGDNFDTSNVTNMEKMFYYSSFSSLVLGPKFNTSNVTNMKNMFRGEETFRIKSIDLGDNFDTSNVTTMYGMFNGSNISSIDLKEKFNTSKVTDMNTMFASTQLRTLSLPSNFIIKSGCDIRGMFSYNYTLTSIKVRSNVDFSLGASGADMFINDIRLVGGSGTKYDGEHVSKEYAKIDGGESNPGYFTLIQ